MKRVTSLMTFAVVCPWCSETVPLLTATIPFTALCMRCEKHIFVELKISRADKVSREDE